MLSEPSQVYVSQCVSTHSISNKQIQLPLTCGREKCEHLVVKRRRRAVLQFRAPCRLSSTDSDSQWGHVKNTGRAFQWTGVTAKQAQTFSPAPLAQGAFSSRRRRLLHSVVHSFSFSPSPLALATPPFSAVIKQPVSPRYSTFFSCDKSPLPAACRLRKIAAAGATVDTCAQLSAACCAAAAAVLGSCPPQTVTGGKTATYMVNLLTRG